MICPHLIFYRTSLILISVKKHKSQDHCPLLPDFGGMCEVILPLSRSAVWKGNKVHYAHLHLAVSHEICENKITQHLRLWHSSKNTCPGFYSSIYSQMPFPKGLKETFYLFFFFVSVDVFQCLFSPQWWWKHKPCCNRGRSRVYFFQLKRSDRHCGAKGFCLSLAYHSCKPEVVLDKEINLTVA